MPVTYFRGRSGSVAYPTSARRGRFWGSGGAPAPAPSGWTGPLGLTWDHAWDLSVVAGGAVPALVGGVDLALGAGSLTPAGSFPATVRSGQRYMSGPGLGVTVSGTELTAVLAGLATTDEDVHVRLIGQAPSASAFWDVQLGGAPAQGGLRLSEFGTVDRYLARLHNNGGGVLLQRTESGLAIGDVVVFDVIARNDGGGARLDVYVNGVAATVSTATAWDGLFNRLLAVEGDGYAYGWVGVRRASLTQAQHDDAVAEVLA